MKTQITVKMIAEALVDAADHWDDTNWPYGDDMVEFKDKHREAIAEARKILGQTEAA